MKIEFPAHGGLEIEVEDNIINIFAEGPFNVEYFSNLHRALKNAAPYVNIDNYGVLISMSGEAVALQEGLKKHKDFVRRAGTKFIAIVIPSDSQTFGISKKMITNTYQGVVTAFDFFDSVDAASCWLRAHLDNA